MRTASAVLALAGLLALSTPAQSQVSFGATAAYHDDFDVGLGPILEFPLPQLHENVRAQGEFIWFFPGDGLDYFEVNGNVLYDFEVEDQSFTPFVLGGLNLARVSLDTEGSEFMDYDASSTELGLNLGAGLTFATESSLRPSVGARVEVSGGEGVVIFGSVLLGGGGS